MNKSLVIANTEEYYYAATRKLPEPFRRAWSKAAGAVAGGALFWGPAPCAMVLPRPVRDGLACEIFSRMGCPEPQIFSPPGDGGHLCLDLMAHPWLARKVADSLRKEETSNLEVWGETPQLIQLTQTLCDKGVALDRGCLSLDQGWKVQYLDSKAGFRDLCSPIGSCDAVVRRGWLAANIAEAGRLVEKLLVDGHAVVVKADRGVAGTSNVLFTAGKHLKFSPARHLTVAARTRPELLAGPLTVERWLRAPAGLPPSASAQCLVRDGSVKILFLAAHTFDSEGLCTGASMGVGALERALAGELEKMAAAICRRASGLGYRGVMGIDFAIDEQGRPVAVEINARRTTASAAAGAAARVFGEDWTGKCHALLLENVSGPNLGELPSRLTRLLFPIGSNSGGWLPIPSLQPYSNGPDWSGAIVLAESAESAFEIAEHLEEFMG